MQIRRCAVLWLEPRETAHFDLGQLLSGGTGVVTVLRWFAHAPHLPAAVEVPAAQVLVLGAVSPADCCPVAALRERHGADVVDALLQAGLLVEAPDDVAPGDGATGTGVPDQVHGVAVDQDGASGATLAAAPGVGALRDHAAADARLRAQHWHGLAAVAHAGSRWDGIDAAGEVAEAGMDTAEALRRKFGAPPPALHDREGAGPAVALPRAARTPLDDVFDRRSTCRNFDTARPLPLAAFAHVLERSFGARGQVQATEDFDVLKRTSPSGGALHPTEAYLIVRHVDGLPPGLYHYRPADHALQPLPFDTAAPPPGAARHAAAQGLSPLDALAWIAVGGQAWFAQAHALVVLAPRFARNYWKYRNHAKAYRVCILDVGHLSQTLLLTAAELGLGAYVTAAINEADIERAFGLASHVDGPLAVCGLGVRAARMTTAELDPNHAVWPRKP